MPITDILDQPDRPATLEARIASLERLAKSERLTTNFLIYGLMSAMGNDAHAAVDEAARKLGAAVIAGDLEQEARDIAAGVLRRIAQALNADGPVALQ